MEKIDTAMVRHMAQLSRLSLTEEEITRYTEQLGAILEYASRLPELEGQAEPSSLRADDDEIRPCQDGQSLLRNAVSLEKGYVKVPAILDKSES